MGDSSQAGSGHGGKVPNKKKNSGQQSLGESLREVCYAFNGAAGCSRTICKFKHLCNKVDNGTMCGKADHGKSNHK